VSIGKKRRKDKFITLSSTGIGFNKMDNQILGA
jgi:hypothetical protein